MSTAEASGTDDLNWNALYQRAWELDDQDSTKHRKLARLSEAFLNLVVNYGRTSKYWKRLFDVFFFDVRDCVQRSLTAINGERMGARARCSYQ